MPADKADTSTMRNWAGGMTAVCPVGVTASREPLLTPTASLASLVPVLCAMFRLFS
jgi:hypothetical protein